MDVSSSSATLLRPRLRLLRRSPSPRIPDGPDTTPQPGPFSARSLFAGIHDEEDEFPTPRIHPKPIASLNPDPSSSSFPTPTSATPIPAETPAARLRALLAREPRPPKNATPAPPSAPPSEADSAVGPPRFGSSTSSVSRESLKDIFSRALRDPGDTPQKGRLRRNSFDGSSMEITPVVGRDRTQRRAARRSLSDEEAEKPKSNRQPNPSFRLSTAASFDTLRARLVSSQSQLVDQDLPEALLYDHTSLASTGTFNSQHHPPAATASSQFNPTHAAPSGSSSTPHPSFQMSSQLAFQSNLLEQDSEMQRAMGDVLNSESEASTPAPPVARSTAIPPDPRPSSSLRGKDGSKVGPRRTSHEFDSSATTSLMNGRPDGIHQSQEEERNYQRERERNRPRLQSRPSTPDVHRRHSQEFHRRLSQEFRSSSHTKSFSNESVVSQSGPAHRTLERRGSVTSLRSFDDGHSSRPSSISSQADYRDRISELERERNHEREREWNRRYPPSRPSSSLSTSSNHSFSHSHTHPPRSPSASTHLTPTHASLQRKSSRTSLRSDSPASLSSSHDSLREQELEEKKEITHERERNWNSPRPHWSTSKSPSASRPEIRNKDNSSSRGASSLTHPGDSHGHRDTSWASNKLQTVLPKADSLAATSSAPLDDSGGRPNSVLDKSDAEAIRSTPLNGSSPTPAATSKFGWNFARSPLPPLELDDAAERRRSTSSPTPDSQPSSRTSTSSHIPVRSRMKGLSSVGHAPSDMSLTHVVGDESSFQQDYQSRSTEVVQPYRGETPAARNSWSQEDIVLASDEESVDEFPPQSTTPKSNPPNPIPEENETDGETEVLTSPSVQGSPRSGKLASIPNDMSLEEVGSLPGSQTPKPPQREPSISATPPGTPPSADTRFPASEVTPSFALVTPPRQSSFGSSILDFRTPSPPHDLPDLPGPPSSSDDDALGNTLIKDRGIDANSNFTLTKTPKPPGGWITTPLPPKSQHRSFSPEAFFPLESTPPASTSTPLPRANTHPFAHTEIETDSPGEDGLLTPVGTLSRARSLPLRTPAPPGAWMATPGQSALLNNGVDQSQYGSIGRRKGLLKVRFDVTESETSATEGRPNSPLSAIRLANPELPLSKLTTDRGADDSVEAVVNGVPQPPPISTTPHRPATPERPTTPTSRENGASPRSLRRSPAVRLVDAYGRERVGEEGIVEPLPNLPNGHANVERKATTPPLTPRRSLVRVVDAMGREVDDAAKIRDASEGRVNKSFEADISVISDDTPIGHAEALARMRKTLRDLADSLGDNDRSEDLELNSSHLEQLEEVSKTARFARNQLAHNLQLETAKHDDLHRSSKFSAWTRGLVPVTKKSWNTTIVYCGVLIQLLFFLAMWRYAHAEAHRLFYTKYYDPLYPELTPIHDGSCLGGPLTTSGSWTMVDSYDTILQEGWRSVGKEILRAMRHIGDQAWERWGEHARLEKPT